MIPEDEYREGLARADRELEPETSYSLEWSIVVAERP
jgi:hypothetical protein